MLFETPRVHSRVSAPLAAAPGRRGRPARETRRQQGLRATAQAGRSGCRLVAGVWAYGQTARGCTTLCRAVPRYRLIMPRDGPIDAVIKLCESVFVYIENRATMLAKSLQTQVHMCISTLSLQMQAQVFCLNVEITIHNRICQQRNRAVLWAVLSPPLSPPSAHLRQWLFLL